MRWSGTKTFFGHLLDTLGFMLYAAFLGLFSIVLMVLAACLVWQLVLLLPWQ